MSSGAAYRAVLRPGVYMALKRGLWKALANGYFWACAPLVRLLYRKGI